MIKVALWLGLVLFFVVGYRLQRYVPLSEGAYLGLLFGAALLSTLGLLLVEVVKGAVLKALPEHPKVQPVVHSVGVSTLEEVAEGFQRAGMKRVGDQWQVNMEPPVALVGFVHATEPVYGTAYVSRSGRVVVDFTSILAGRTGLLTTTNARDAGLMPEPGHLRQVDPDASPDALYQRHTEALAFLSTHGLELQPVSKGTFASDLAWGITHASESFRRASRHRVMVTLWRQLASRSPHVGALHAQPNASAEIAALRQQT